MKSKIEKEVNLPDLIEWAWDNPKLSGNERFYSNDVERNGFGTFQVDSIVSTVTGYVSIKDKVTVQEER
ncbi:hypothetical protein [Staphylococcus aureus]|uniref:hypothetical protein n=1 Tax=Staphylococcus aureus TaxID=1280 RepID=UPI0011D26869|nr:hypothetical protein [Staphylococcus aureus]